MLRANHTIFRMCEGASPKMPKRALHAAVTSAMAMRPRALLSDDDGLLLEVLDVDEAQFFYQAHRPPHLLREAFP